MKVFDWLLARPNALPADLFHPVVRVEVLVVEDQPEEREIVTTLLRLQNCVVTEAATLAEALVCINGPSRFQLALIDLQLPNGDGIEAVRRLKAARRNTHVVVVSGSFEKIAAVLSCGYVGVLGKPYSTSAVREILAKHRLPYND